MQLDPSCKISERPLSDPKSGDRFVGLTVVDGASILDSTNLDMAPTANPTELESAFMCSKPVEKLHCIPFFFRSNIHVISCFLSFQCCTVGMLSCIDA